MDILNSFKNKPTIFIASSSEGLEVARAVKSNFNHEADVDIWTENIFSKNENFLNTLLNRASFYDFAICVLTPDDKAAIRGEVKNIAKDNVIFEFGLFLGRIGKKRAFIIKEKTVHLLSDFDGVSISTYESRDNIVADVGEACSEIRREIKSTSKLLDFTLLPSTSLAIGYYENFIKKISEAFKSINNYTIYQKDKEGKKINLQTRNIRDSFPIINVLVPEKLSKISPDNLFDSTHEFKRVTLETPYRPFGLYMKGDIQDLSNSNFYDIPTTLYTSYETINRVFGAEFLARDNNIEAIEKKEITNFKKVLYLMNPQKFEDKKIVFKMLK